MWIYIQVTLTSKGLHGKNDQKDKAFDVYLHYVQKKYLVYQFRYSYYTLLDH